MSVVVLGNPSRDKIFLQDHICPGHRGAIPCYAGMLGPESPVLKNRQFVRVRDLFVLIPHEELAIAAFAVRMIDFDIRPGFCGRCARQYPPAHDRACETVWHLRSYCLPPPIPGNYHPRAAGRPDPACPVSAVSPGMFGLIAGFVEPADNPEHALVREVQEETGIYVKKIRYFGREPWPFPDSLMVGFTAEFAGGKLVMDKNENEAAFWFDRRHLPRIPEKLSISRTLIDRWIEKGQ